jgi:hypothetical protein
MQFPPLSAAEEETHTPLALELREIARRAPEGEFALCAATDYLLARIAGIFESHPRLLGLGYQPTTVDGQASRTGLVKIPPPEQDGEYPQFDDIEREDAGDAWMDVLGPVDDAVIRRVFGAETGTEAHLSRSQVSDLYAALEERIRLTRQQAA